MGWRITLAEPALADLGEAVAFLARKSPVAAERLGLALVASIFSLALLPRCGLAMAGRPNYRRILHPPWFLIYYRLDEQNRRIEVVRVWDARQDPASLALS